jgi:hypothetical protein
VAPEAPPRPFDDVKEFERGAGLPCKRRGQFYSGNRPFREIDRTQHAGKWEARRDMGAGRYCQDRAGGLPQNLLCDGPEQQVLEPTCAMRPHHDQIRRQVTCPIEDRLHRLPDVDEHIDGGVCAQHRLDEECGLVAGALERGFVCLVDEERQAPVPSGL